MRIGEVAARTGLSARVIRSFEARGWARSRHAGADHRRYDEADVARLGALRALRAADVPLDLAVRAADGALDAAERERVGRALALLGEQVRAAAATVHPDPRADGDRPEDDISLMFDTFLVRTRMESVLTAALRPAGVISGDYAIISLIAVGGPMTPATIARLVGTAPSTLGGRIASLVRRGVVRRVPDPTDRRSWRLELTAEGQRLLVAAYPHADVCLRRLNAALHCRGVHPETVRAALLDLSAALRGLLPDVE